MAKKFVYKKELLVLALGVKQSVTNVFPSIENVDNLDFFNDLV